MTWFRVDDGFCDHPKVIGCSLAAIGLWVKAGAWCSKHLTDGAVPAAMVRALGGSPKLAAELVAAGLWVATDAGYGFHDWSARNPTRRDVESRREEDAERKRRERASAERPSGHAPDSVPDSAGSPRARARVPVPARPIPSHPDPSVQQSARGAVAEDPDEQEARLEELHGDPPEPDRGRDPSLAVAAALLGEWDRQVCGGFPSLALSVAAAWLEPAIPALEARANGAGITPLFAEKLTAWLGARRSKTPPQLRFFCQDLPALLASPRSAGALPPVDDWGAQ